MISIYQWDWFRGIFDRNLPYLFHGKNPWVSGFNFPANQSIEYSYQTNAYILHMYIYVYVMCMKFWLF